jgi:predicted TIM-barrel fold metal-dependent hydrolase
VYAKEGVPSLDGDAWQNLFSVLRAQNKHVLVFGAYTNIAATVAQIPQDIAVVIDHLGLPSLDDVEGYEVLLQALKERGNVYLKGPGYRTSLEVEKIIPLVRKAKELLGSEALMLGATDGPFAGPIVDPKSPEKGKPLADFINYQTVQQYTATLAEGVSDDQQEQEQLLYGNAKRFYKF